MMEYTSIFAQFSLDSASFISYSDMIVGRDFKGKVKKDTGNRKKQNVKIKKRRKIRNGKNDGVSQYICTLDSASFISYSDMIVGRDFKGKGEAFRSFVLLFFSSFFLFVFVFGLSSFLLFFLFLIFLKNFKETGNFLFFFLVFFFHWFFLSFKPTMDYKIQLMSLKI